MGDTAPASTPEAGNVLHRLVLPICLVVVTYFAIGRWREYRRLSHFKGPPTTGISWWWHSRAVIGGQAHKYYGDVCERYGPIARVGEQVSNDEISSR